MYTYQQLLEDVEYLRYKGLGCGIIGRTELGNEIPYIHYGSTKGKQIIITGGIHARENVSSAMVIRQAFAIRKQGGNIDGGIYFIPMINADGAILIEKGADQFKNIPLQTKISRTSIPHPSTRINESTHLCTDEQASTRTKEEASTHSCTDEQMSIEEVGYYKDRREFLLAVNGGSGDFSLYKANINAVDLNTNFDADFGKGISNKRYPSPSDYVGKAAFDQAETRSLRDFTKAVNPSLTISYHALGREIYWYYGQSLTKARDERIASYAASKLGYKKLDSSMGSCGGYKDWCIQKLHIPSLTIELGSNELTHPLSESMIESDMELNTHLPLELMKLISSMKG